MERPNAYLVIRNQSRGAAGGAAAPPDFRNLCSKSPNHVVYSPTIAPPAPQSWRPPCKELESQGKLRLKRRFFSVRLETKVCISEVSPCNIS